MEESSVAIMPLPPDSSMTMTIIPLSIKAAKQKTQISITLRPRRDAAAEIN
ncbi:MAG TPA: hypothetical protein VG270_10340 [Pseudolabrys sp.]|nr:hypothetical protein [Pseudolabrys sp.]